jgi:hypothetical protein
MLYGTTLATPFGLRREIDVPEAALPQPKKIQINSGSGSQARVEAGSTSTGNSDKS